MSHLLSSFLLAATLSAALAAQIRIGGTVSDATTGPLLSGNTYVVTSSLFVPAGATLTVQPDVVVKFPLANLMTVRGSLQVNGTAARPVTFTSLHDDTVGVATATRAPRVEHEARAGLGGVRRTPFGHGHAHAHTAWYSGGDGGNESRIARLLGLRLAQPGCSTRRRGPRPDGR